jgi:hypothetical protein
MIGQTNESLAGAGRTHRPIACRRLPPSCGRPWSLSGGSATVADPPQGATWIEPKLVAQGRFTE